MPIIKLADWWLYRALMAIGTPGGQLCVMLVLFCILLYGSWARIPETDLMKQAFAAIMAFITGGSAGYAKGRRDALRPPTSPAEAERKKV